MAVSAPPRPPEPALPDDRNALEALIEEARRRARRRRLLYGVAALAAGALGAGVFFAVGNDGDAGRPAEQAQPPGAPALPAPLPVTAKNGELTIVAGDAIANLLPSGQLRTIVLCERMGHALCAAHPRSLDWAPDGRRLAYATAIGPGAAAAEWKNVALHVLDTVTRRHISRRLSCFAQSIDWSRDGAQLAYACEGRIYVIASDLSSPPRVLRAGLPESLLASPSWAPDGTQIALTAAPRGRPSETAPRIYVAPTAPGDRQAPVLVARGWSPAWSPDGTRIAYRAGCGGIKLVTPAGLDATPASVVLKCRAIGIGGAPLWSPDRRRLAISVQPLDRRVLLRPPGLYVMNPDGTGLRRVGDQPSGILGGGSGGVSWRPQPASR